MEISFKDGVAVVHIRNFDLKHKIPATTGGITMLVIESPHVLDGITVREARLAICSNEDVYSKKIGRDKAMTNPDVSVLLSDEELAIISKFGVHGFMEVMESSVSFRDYGKLHDSLTEPKTPKNTIGRQLGRAQARIKELEAKVNELKQFEPVGKEYDPRKEDVAGL